MRVISIVTKDLEIISLDKNYEVFYNEKDSEINIKKVSNSYYCYHNQIEGLTCIVGKNGVGKTTLMTKLYNNLFNKNSDYFYYQLIEDRGVLYYLETINKKKKLDIFFLEKSNKKRIDPFEDSKSPTNIFYSSTIETFRSNKEYLDKYDLSLTCQLNNSNISEVFRINMFKQIRFVLENHEPEEFKDKNNSFINFEDKRINFTLSSYGENIYNTRKYNVFGESIEKIMYEKYIEKRLKSNPDRYTEKRKSNKVISKKMYKTLIANYFSIFSRLLEENDSIIAIKNKIKDKKVDFIEIRNEMYSLIQEEAKKQKNKIKYNTDINSIEIINNLKDMDEAFEELLFLIDTKVDEFDLRNESDREFVQKIIDFSNSENPLKKDLIKIFNFQWIGLSSGEFSLLNMYGNFNTVLKDDNTNQNVVIFIDEADIGFHPEWQRRWLEIFSYYIPLINKNKKIYLFISTHSPIILSDIVEKDVLFMKERNKFDDSMAIKTFGQNIHTLFNLGFFMDRTIGNISEKHISNLFYLLSGTYFEDLEELKYLSEIDSNSKQMDDLINRMKYFAEFDERDFPEFKILAIQNRDGIEKDIYKLFNTLLEKDQVELKQKIFINIFKIRFKNNISEEDRDILSVFKKIEYLIDMIGEPIYKDRLILMFKNMKRDLSFDNSNKELIKSKIASLENEIKELQSQIEGGIDD